MEATRVGFGKALLELGDEDRNVAAVCADFNRECSDALVQREIAARSVEVGITGRIWQHC